MLHIYTGEGKGKTTAAMGLALRAIGHGKKVVIVQFLKSGNSGELGPLSALGATIFSGKGGTKFISAMSEEEKKAARRLHDLHLERAMQEPCDMLILDEVCAAIKYGMVDLSLVEQAVALKNESEVVLTGRDPARFLLDAADYVTEMKCICHPYEKGVRAREGVEY